VARTTNQEAHARRRAQLVEAVFRIVRRDGIEHVSVRNVAREAGLSMGSLRHYFATQGELLAFSLGEVERRFRARLADLDTSAPPRQLLEQVLHQLVPLSPESRVEHEIWFAFVGKATAEPALRTLNARIYDELRDLVRQVVALIERPGLDPDLETERLYALVDGLALHAVLRPEQWPPERITALLAYHLDGLDSVTR
jgi:AcrR family transcriptional regulator